MDPLAASTFGRATVCFRRVIVVQSVSLSLSLSRSNRRSWQRGRVYRVSVIIIIPFATSVALYRQLQQTAATQTRAMAAARKVLLAIDASDQAEQAFDCKY